MPPWLSLSRTAHPLAIMSSAILLLPATGSGASQANLRRPRWCARCLGLGCWFRVVGLLCCSRLLRPAFHARPPIGAQVGRLDAGLVCLCIPIVVVAATPDDQSCTHSACKPAACLQVCVAQFPPDTRDCLHLAAVLCKPSSSAPGGVRVVGGLLVDLVLLRCSRWFNCVRSRLFVLFVVVVATNLGGYLRNTVIRT